MSTTEALKPRRSRLLDSVPLDKRVVIHDVTWDVYENLLNQVGDARNCRIAFDGKDHLRSDGKYVPVSRSLFLPVRSEDVTRRVFSEDWTSLVMWEERLRVWVRSEFVPELNG
jgi:hypothetical protein